MTTLAEFLIIASADNRPPMLEKSLYDSWKSRIELCIKNQENEGMILNSLQNGPLVWPTVVEEDGTTRTKKYEELSVVDKLQADCDLKATKIVIQGLPSDVYAIVNHHKVAKDTWDRVKLLMQGTKLSLQEKECKFLPPEWSKFVTDVKLARDLHTTNYNQLYSCIEQHEAHANETRLMRERYQDPLVFVANYNQSPSQLNNYHSQYDTTQFPQQTNTMIPQIHYSQSYSPILAVSVFNQGDDPIVCLNKTMAFLIAIASSKFPSTNNQLRTSSNLRNQATIQDDRVTVQQVQGKQGQSYAGNSYKGNATSLGGNNTGGQAKMRPTNAAWFKEKAMLAEAQEAGNFLNEEQLAFLTDPCILDGKAVVLMANLSNYGSDVISKVPHHEPYHTDMDSQKKESKYMDKEIDLAKKIKELDNIVYKVGQSAQTMHMLTKPQVFYDDSHKQALGYQNPFYLKKAQRIKPTLYDGSVISSQHVATPVMDDEETLILEEVSRSKMLAKQNDPMLQTSHPNADQSASSSVKIEAPKELPKVSLVNTSLKKLKYHLGQFDTVVKKRITPDTITEWNVV
nr:hypothetical protein [Tanacetum cinerariifolium]